MKTIKITLDENIKPLEELDNLKNYIQEYKLKGLIVEFVQIESNDNSMGASEYLPILQLVLNSTVLAAGVKGLFDILKNYFELKKEKLRSIIETEKLQVEKSLLELDIEDEKGKKTHIKIKSFSDEERKMFFELISK
jgi:hypothetical protein